MVNKELTHILKNNSGGDKPLNKWLLKPYRAKPWSEREGISSPVF